jgi:hypothetical protein
VNTQGIMRAMTVEEKEFFLDLLDFYEFELISNEDNTFSLKDLQGANLGDIEEDVFKDEWEVLDRLDIYHLDYIIRPIEEIYDVNFITYEEYLDFLLSRPQEEDNVYFSKALKLITLKGFK